ncbi:MAG: histidinol-phosphate transaminase [Clostridia bacterium]|nr:histidinol-phosphate transaminase [Clostridia bacterium]
MSRYFSSKYSQLTPYTPGEQPQDMVYTKLNTNECPFPPSEKAMEYLYKNLRPLNLYSDPQMDELRKILAETYDITPDMLCINNGSDESLNFAFMAFCDENRPAVFADITYGFYPVFADLNKIPYEIIPLEEDFSIDPKKYMGLNKTIFIANPNAPTGKILPVSTIEEIVKSNPEGVVIIDEAYVDFGGESSIGLTKKYDNVMVIQTFSKSRSLAGGRLGFAAACPALIQDLNTIRYSTNPYNINSMTAAAGIGTLKDPEYTKRCCNTIIENRAYLAEELKKRGFEFPESVANFIFAKSPKIDGGELYRKLKEKGVLVRHFDKETICQYNRITIGTRQQLDVLLAKIDEIMEEMQ